MYLITLLLYMKPFPGSDIGPVGGREREREPDIGRWPKWWLVDRSSPQVTHSRDRSHPRVRDMFGDDFINRMFTYEDAATLCNNRCRMTIWEWKGLATSDPFWRLSLWRALGSMERGQQIKKFWTILINFINFFPWTYLMVWVYKFE